MEYGILSIAIPILTILLAIITKDVIVSLMGGIFAGFLVINNFNPIDSFLDIFNGIINLFTQAWIVKTVIFMLLVGSIIKLLTVSNAVDNFVHYISNKSKSIDSPKGAMLLAYTLGVVIFIESSITSLVSGTVAKPLCDKHGVSREKLAYICDSSSAPICSLIPLNAWGALLLGLIVTAIDANVIGGNAIELLIESIPYNFYAIFTLVIVMLVILFKIDIGDMKTAKPVTYIEINTNTNTNKENSNPLQMVLPIILLVIMVPVGLYVTGEGDILQGSGSSSVYYAVIVTLIFIYIYYIPSKLITHKKYFKAIYSGIASMIPVTLILIFALLIGDVISKLDTANYLANILHGNIDPYLIPLLIFLVASLTAFSTGTSWGTFSIMMPIALSLGATLDIHLPLVIAAVISGGIFGDHASPISDTTIISSMAAQCDHISHVRTQLPYAIIGAILASIAFLILGVLQS